MSQHALQLTREARELAAVDAIKVEDANRLEHLRKAFGVDDRNFKTAYDIGMHFWREAGEGASGYEEVSKQAIEWFARASAGDRLRQQRHDNTPYGGSGRRARWMQRPVRGRRQPEPTSNAAYCGAAACDGCARGIRGR